MKFFEGTKARRLILSGFHAEAIQDANVIVLDFEMPLYDKVRVVDSAPDFIRRICSIVAHDECGVRSVSSKTEILGVDFEMYKLDPDDEFIKNDGAIILTLSKTILTKIKITRPNKPFAAESEIRLHFTVAYGWHSNVWEWAEHSFNTSFWVKFSGKQIEFKAGRDEEAQPELLTQTPVPTPEQAQKPKSKEKKRANHPTPSRKH